MNTRKFILFIAFALVVTGDTWGAGSAKKENNQPWVLPVFSTTNQNGVLLANLLTAGSQSNILVTANAEHPIDCTIENTNRLSNTNLLSPEEAARIDERSRRVKDLKFDSSPNGLTLKKTWTNRVDISVVGKSVYPGKKVFMSIGYKRFSDGNTTETWADFLERVIVRRRDKNGDGYDLTGWLEEYGQRVFYQEFAHSLAQGPMVELQFDDDLNKTKILSLVRFDHGLAIERYFTWGRKTGDMTTKAEFQKPYDFINNCIVRYDYSWIFNVVNPQH